MAWQNLNEDLDELFGEFTHHTERMLEALESRRQYWNLYMRRYWKDNPGKYRAHLDKVAAANRARRAAMSPEERAAYLAKARARSARRRAALRG